ncbi:unnamed protein product [Notodromas monacha]|uniref:Secreted protein n=1 Tax=Notodromas monacha TaxID=399045 RepID=A0A7R9BEQ8_9CRUS|nr:unnamed protein product [Notodromas monacha]CAG0913990.1 unnamed protein product [Notodromas monacha]
MMVEPQHQRFLPLVIVVLTVLTARGSCRANGTSSGTMALHRYKPRFSVQQLLTSDFPHRISRDLFSDPCKGYRSGTHEVAVTVWQQLLLIVAPLVSRGYLMDAGPSSDGISRRSRGRGVMKQTGHAVVDWASRSPRLTRSLLAVLVNRVIKSPD